MRLTASATTTAITDLDPMAIRLRDHAYRVDVDWVRIFCDGRKLIDSANLVSDGLSGSIAGG